MVPVSNILSSIISHDIYKLNAIDSTFPTASTIEHKYMSDFTFDNVYLFVYMHLTQISYLFVPRTGLKSEWLQVVSLDTSSAFSVVQECCAEIEISSETVEDSSSSVEGTIGSVSWYSTSCKSREGKKI